LHHCYKINSMGKVLCFGELLLRLSPSLNGQWLQQNSMPVYMGGAELNVATALALWGIPAKYVTALPNHYLAQEAATALQQKGIDVSGIHWGGERIGTYYLPQGTDLKNAGVIYDRAHSAFADLQPGSIDWATVLQGCSWFHFSAIGPALSQRAADVCEEAVLAAKKRGLTISVDLNYRAKLWQYGVPPTEVMPRLVRHCHVIMGNLWAAEALLGIASPIDNSGGKTNEALIAAAGQSMLQLHNAYPNATSFAYTFRLAHQYFAVLQHGPEMAATAPKPLGQVVDRVGSGDCFMAGLVYGLYKGLAPQQVVDFAAAAALGKLAEVGDATQQTVSDILQII
jgi:2-dehydro-3-deoxygluconokinase